METALLLQTQEKERARTTKEIIDSPEKRKLIVSGPGTGKTYIFEKIIKKQSHGEFLITTFIRKLIADIDKKIQIKNTCKTFHEFAKGILHKQIGLFYLQPFLSEIVKKDAGLLGLKLTEFDKKFQELDENSPEILFYLKRSDFYKTVSFNDSVYRVFKLAQRNEDLLPRFNQIIVDEYQDFNKLEIEFIKILEKRGPILIAGDDDQALYDGRSASSKYIKKLCRSGCYKLFTPKYCSRCTKAIVEAANAFIKKAQLNGNLKDRIDKQYECYLPDKAKDSKKYPQIDYVECSTIDISAKYILSCVKRIEGSEIEESFKENEEYPTVLVIGPSHYLKVIYDKLLKTYKNTQFNPKEETKVSIIEAYRILMDDNSSNLGWRIIAEFSLNRNELIKIITETENNIKIIDLLSEEVIDHHAKILKLIINISNEDTFKDEQIEMLKKLSSENSDDLIKAFKYKEETEESNINDKADPSILLTSYKGAKGLSGGQVFILGVHNKLLPKKKSKISDIEISQFLVAMTRARKKLHLVNNRWYKNPVDKNNKFKCKNEKSSFIDWIPQNLINDLGYKRSKDFK